MAPGSPQEEFSDALHVYRQIRPSPASDAELMEAMHKLADREIKAGRMLDSGGLMPLATGAQVRIADGQLSVLDGPFVEAKEVIGGYAIFELPGKEEAVASATEFMQLHKDFMPGWEGTCELRAFAGRTCCVPNSAMKRYAWAACSPPSRRTSPKPMDCSP